MNIDNIRPKTPKLKAETVKPRKKYPKSPPSPSSLNLMIYEIFLNQGLTSGQLKEVTGLSFHTVYKCLPKLFEDGEISKVFLKNAGASKVYKFYYNKEIPA